MKKIYPYLCDFCMDIILVGEWNLVEEPLDSNLDIDRYTN